MPRPTDQECYDSLKNKNLSAFNKCDNCQKILVRIKHLLSKETLELNEQLFFEEEIKRFKTCINPNDNSRAAAAMAIRELVKRVDSLVPYSNMDKIIIYNFAGMKLSPAQERSLKASPINIVGNFMKSYKLSPKANKKKTRQAVAAMGGRRRKTTRRRRSRSRR